MKLVLASTSPYRRKLLERLRLPFEVAPPDVDEEKTAPAGAIPVAIAEALARAKAEAVAVRFPGATVIGSDQLVDLQGAVLGKPLTRKGALAQLGRLAGKTHALITSVVVLAPAIRVTHTDISRLTMEEFPADALARYVDADRPFDCAGSYRIESLGISLFRRIETEDPTAIEGLPLQFVARALRSLGFRAP